MQSAACEKKSEIVYESCKKDHFDQEPDLLKPYSPRNGHKFNAYLYFCAIISCFLVFSIGNSISWSSPMIPKLNGLEDPENNPLSEPLTRSQESLIASLLGLGAATGPFFAAKLADVLGRKTSQLCLAVPVVISHLLCAFATIVSMFYIARILIGATLGGLLVILPLYISEIAEDRNRDTLVCLMCCFFNMGVSFTYVVGPLVTIKTFSIFSIIPAVIFVIFFSLFTPETPYHLGTVGKKENAEKSLRMLRNRTNSIVNNEIIELHRSIESFGSSKGGFTDLHKVKSLRSRLILTTVLVLVQQMTGISAIGSYTQQIFEGSGSSITPYVATIVLSGASLISVAMTSVIVRKLGKRFLLLISSLGCGLSLTTFAVYFYLHSHEYDVSGIFWLPMVTLIVYTLCYNWGVGPLPFAILGEIFPTNVKASAASLVVSFSYVAHFIVTLVFPHLCAIIGMSFSFAIFSVCCFVGFVYIYFNVVETKGKSLFEIQQMFNDIDE